ncbi:3356_t:CDS:1, partial [Gigaspora margarita]
IKILNHSISFCSMNPINMSAILEFELIELMNFIVTFIHIENSYENPGDVELDDFLDNTRESASDIDIIKNNVSNILSIPELSDTNSMTYIPMLFNHLISYNTAQY